MKISGIYQIQSMIKPERIYIGSSVNIHIRWRDHLYMLKKGIHENSKLQNHYNKYGKCDLIFSVVIGCAKDDLISTEQFYLDSKKHWFNICPKAMSSAGVKRSDEHKKKSRLINLGRKHSEEVRQKESENRKGENNPFFNKKHSEESNEKGENGTDYILRQKKPVKNKENRF